MTATSQGDQPTAVEIPEVDMFGLTVQFLVVILPAISLLIRVGILPPLDMDDELWKWIPDASLLALLIRVFIGLIVAVPFVYFWLNSRSVPRTDSTDTLFDDYTRKLDEKESFDICARG